MPNLQWLKKKYVYYYDLATSEDSPQEAKLLFLAAVIYLFSPIDLIPDFIPIIGFIDDLIIVPLLVSAAFRRIEAAKAEKERQKRELEAMGHNNIEHCESDA